MEIASGLIEECRLVKKRNTSSEYYFRGTIGGFPVEFTTVVGGSISIEVQVPGERDWINLEYLPYEEQAPETPFDPAWDDPEERRVYVTPSVFAQGEDAPETIHAYLNLRADLVGRIQTSMREERIMLFDITPYGIKVHFVDALCLMLEPVARVRKVLQLILNIIPALSPASIPTEDAPQEPTDRHLDLQCRYCATWYPRIAGTSPRCPQCGAHYDGDRHPEA